MTPDISNSVDPKMAISPRRACALESDALSALCDSTDYRCEVIRREDAAVNLWRVARCFDNEGEA
jgi:hypothetical protein